MQGIQELKKTLLTFMSVCDCFVCKLKGLFFVTANRQKTFLK